MNHKRDEPEFEIQQTTSLPTVASSGPMNPFFPGQPVNKPEKQIQQGWRNSMANMQAAVIKAHYAHNAMAFLQLHGLSVYDQASRHIYAIKSAEREEALQPYIDKYSKRVLEDLATRQFGLNDVAIANIAYTVHRDHYPPEVVEEEKGWFARLLGVK